MENIQIVQVQVSNLSNGTWKDLRTRLFKVDLSEHPLAKIYVLEKLYKEKEKLAKRLNLEIIKNLSHGCERNVQLTDFRRNGTLICFDVL